MTEFLTYFDTHWIQAFALLFLTFGIIKLLIVLPIRALLILFRGWPPSHLDADGDFHNGNE